MKTRPAAHQNRGMTLTEVVVVIGMFALLAVVILPTFNPAHRHSGPNCLSNLKLIGLAFKTWEGDHGDKFPMQFALTNSETMKLISSGNAYVLWQTMSNELSTPKVLRCPNDSEHTAATNFATGFSDANISYFFNLEAADTYPQMILDGDDNLAVNGFQVKSGILNLPTTGSLAWTIERHRGVGNIGMADGSVQQFTPTTLNAAVIAATNGASVASYRWAIP